MLMPAKHITFSESILGLGSYVLKVLDKPNTISPFVVTLVLVMK